MQIFMLLSSPFHKIRHASTNSIKSPSQINFNENTPKQFLISYLRLECDTDMKDISF
jgi:hypothetical protein